MVNCFVVTHGLAIRYYGYLSLCGFCSWRKIAIPLLSSLFWMDRTLHLSFELQSFGDLSDYTNFFAVLRLRPCKIALIAVVGCSVGCRSPFICGNARHLGDALQYRTVREKMQGILEMPSING